MVIFSIGAHGESDRLEVETMADSQSIAMDDWLPVRVKIRVKGFVADVQISIVPVELLHFKEALEPVYRDIRGHAQFKTMEQQLFIAVEIDKLGHVTASGFLQGDFQNSNRLVFTLKFDQTLLQHTISEIDEFLFEVTKSKNG